MDMSISASTSVSIGSDWVEGAGWLVDAVGSDITREKGREIVYCEARSDKVSEMVEVNVRCSTQEPRPNISALRDSDRFLAPRLSV